MLLRGITLSADQQTRLRELADQRRQAQGERPQGGWGANGQGQPQRERGDTTGMGARRAQMQQRREQHIAAIRSILTPDQQAQFDRNVADMKAHQGERGGRERPNQR
jgi:Spy/CpxP family protein refolding chaperone